MRRLILGLLCLLPATVLVASEPAAATKYEVPYRLTDTKHVLVRVKLNGKGPFNLICDTGAPAVFITKNVAKEVGATADDKGWATFDSFVLEGGLPVDKVGARVEDLFQLDGMNGMGLAGVKLHGVIGYNVLAKFRITYDFTSDKLVWEPIPNFEPPAMMRLGKGDATGQGGLEVLGSMMKMMARFMGLKANFEMLPRGFTGIEVEAKDSKVVVTAVLPDSPADKAGLKVGDRIERIKSTDIDAIKDLNRALAKAGVGERLTFTVRRGEETLEIIVPLGKGL